MLSSSLIRTETLCVRCAKQLSSCLNSTRIHGNLRSFLNSTKGFHTNESQSLLVRSKDSFNPGLCRKFSSSAPNVSSNNPKSRWKFKIMMGSLAVASVGGAYYFSLNEKDRRKMRVFAGGVRRFVR